ncbi:MAG: Fic family protein, partial [Candidatus Riflebacteria bacterium]|nr:Fic family protein [Candidatus Riflebacteria bacterium]
LALGRLDSVSILLPDTSLFLYMYIRKEAVLSSMIEGTQSSLSDLLTYEVNEVPGVPVDDVQEVSNYVNALNYGIKRIKELPISLRLFKEIHSVLLYKGRGSHSTPGEFRHSQNWIGGTRPGNAHFVPPPPEDMIDCLSHLEKFLNDIPEETPILVKAALMHVQFETIHPFLDGNGRLGRLLITLLLCANNVLKEPMLYLSLYFKTHRTTYYELLNSVRENGDWEEWLEFFADAIIETSNQAVITAKRLVSLSNYDLQKINSLKRISGSVSIVYRQFLEQPISTLANITKKTGLSATTVQSSLNELIKLNIINEFTGNKRNRKYSYIEYISILSEGCE